MTLGCQNVNINLINKKCFPEGGIMAIFTGAGVAIVTPFNEDGSMNYEKFAGLIEFQIENGTDAIIVCGTTGEASTLSHEEHLDAIGFCVKQVAGRVPVVAGTGSNCTETAIYLSIEAEKLGADGLLVVSPSREACSPVKAGLCKYMQYEMYKCSLEAHV